MDLSFDEASSKKNIYARALTATERPSQYPAALEKGKPYLAKILANQLDKDAYGELSGYLKQMYTKTASINWLGRAGTKDGVHTVIFPQECKPDLRIKFAINEKGLDEIWKCANYAKELNEKDKLGWSTVRDWASEQLIDNKGTWRPFYIVELCGFENGAAVLQRGDKGTSELIKFLGEYFFGPTKQESHLAQNGEVAKQHLTHIKNDIIKYINFIADDALRKQRLEQLEDIFIKKITPQLSSQLYTGLIAGDAKAENIIHFNGEASHFAWTDQGHELLADVEQPSHIRGLPLVSLGTFLMSTHPDLNSTIPDNSRTEIKNTLEEFIHNNTWQDRSIMNEELNPPVPYWNKDLKKAAISLGQLWLCIRKENQHGYGKVWTPRVDEILKSLLTGEIKYTY